MDEQKQDSQNPEVSGVAPSSEAAKQDSGEHEAMRKERDEYLESWKRAKADLINYKRDETQRMEMLLKLSNEQLVRDLIPVLDSFDLAIQASQDTKIEKGIFLIRSQFEDVLKKYGLERVMVTIGEHFDPARHEAVASVPSEQEPGTIVEEVERGYMLGGKIIRAARVRVAK